jgi:uncharacterized protein
MGDPLRQRVLASAQECSAADWDGLAGVGSQLGNPFISHAFYKAMEESGSACARTGWAARHLALFTPADQLVGVMPLYLKNHSYGEYVFDHNWAHAYEQAGGRYYPKLQAAVPFTPVPGPRLLAKTLAHKQALALGAIKLAQELRLSSLHATFIAPQECAIFEQADYLIRIGQQFHWHNQGYRDWQDFLDVLSSRKRKMIRKERETALQNGITIECVQGQAIRQEHWEALWRFYLDTSARKWGQPYLTRQAFDLLGQTLSAQSLLVMARRGGRLIAGALNFIGEDALYGRYWGCTQEHPCLHFEVCYYQAIQAAIDLKLARVEAGAQGEHKIARGYSPTPTFSAHWIAHPDFRSAVADFLKRERASVDAAMDYLAAFTPFKHTEQPVILSSPMDDHD